MMRQAQSETRQIDSLLPERPFRNTRQDASGPAAHRAIDLDQLRNHIRTLITLEESAAPLISCYLDLVVGRHGLQPQRFDRRVRAIRQTLSGQDRERFDEALERIQVYLDREIRPKTRGVAIFARAGERPFFLGLQFQVPLPDRLSLNTTPDIFHLVELKDTYHRYVVLISTEESARILEVNLGAITRELWSIRPELRERLGREWAHQHYQNHRRDRGERFLKEKVEILKKLMTAGGHTHLILAGSALMTARVRNALPRRLQAKLIDVVHAPAGASVDDVVLATLSSFINCEQQESLDAVAELVSALRRDGLAVAGTAPTLEALRRGQADVLIMAQAYEPGWAWSCGHCGRAAITLSQPGRCPHCHSSELQSESIKELMVKLAERQSVTVEFVHNSDALMDLGGVGCLHRYATPDQDHWARARSAS